MDIESIITRALEWQQKHTGGDYELNGKTGKFIRLEKDKPINFLPAIEDPTRDLCTFPMHNYVKLSDGSFKSFLCRKVINEPCPLCKAGLKPSRRFFCNVILMNEDDPAKPQVDKNGLEILWIWSFGRTLKQLLDASAALDKGRYDQWVQTLSKTGEGLNTQYSLVRNNKDFHLDKKDLEASKKVYATPWDYLIENVQPSAYADFLESQKEETEADEAGSAEEKA